MAAAGPTADHRPPQRRLGHRPRRRRWPRPCASCSDAPAPRSRCARSPRGAERRRGDRRGEGRPARRAGRRRRRRHGQRGRRGAGRQRHRRSASCRWARSTTSPRTSASRSSSRRRPRRSSPGGTCAIDVGEVNGRVFINNSSLGLYPEIVRDREQQQRRSAAASGRRWSGRPWRRCAAMPSSTSALRIDGTEHSRAHAVRLHRQQRVPDGRLLDRRARRQPVRRPAQRLLHAARRAGCAC